ncbi:MAG: hypothetical protein J6C19_14370, partial [Lachnospiraceae bacterium]|nr:hypothetical protein [Lachnospiraceae bacterium]
MVLFDITLASVYTDAAKAQNICAGRKYDSIQCGQGELGCSKRKTCRKRVDRKWYINGIFLLITVKDVLFLVNIGKQLLCK